MKELVKIIYSVHVAIKLQNTTWRELNTEEETQIATRGKGGQGKLLSLNFIPRERLKRHVVNVLISLFHLGASYYRPSITAAHAQAQCAQGKG